MKKYLGPFYVAWNLYSWDLLPYINVSLKDYSVELGWLCVAIGIE